MLPLVAIVALAAQAVGFHLEPVTADLASRFSATQIAVLEKLNRADASSLTRLPGLVVPDAWPDDELEVSPMPRRYEAAAALSKALIVHLPGQVFGAYERGGLVRWGPISSGAAASPTPPGFYHLNWRAKGRVSTVNPDWYMRWYFNFDNVQGRAFHEYDLPGRPASHGCIRLLPRDAQWLFEWGDEWQLNARGIDVLEPGTAVLIIGPYDYDAPPPWRRPGAANEPFVLPPALPTR